MVKEKPVPGGKKNRKDPKAPVLPTFSPVKIEISDPATLILLLPTKEVSVLVQAMSPLVHFAEKSEECGTQLIDNNILPILLTLLNHENECCRRYAFRIMSHLVFSEKCKLIMIENQETTFQGFLDTLLNATDVVLKEYASKILSILCHDPVLCAYIATATQIETFVNCLSSTDPDVQKNILEIISTILRDPTVIPSQNFTFQPIIQLFSSDYPAIQKAAIDVVYELTNKHKNNSIKELFKKNQGVDKVMSLLERFDWKNVHNKLLQTITNLAHSQVDFEALNPNDIKNLISYVSKATDVNDIKQAWEAILALTHIKASRKVLVEINCLEKLMDMLKAENEDLASLACIGLVNFLCDHENLNTISKRNPLSELLFLIKNSNKWKTKECALVALGEVIRNCFDLHKQLTQNNKYEVLTGFLKLPLDEVPVEILKGAIDCLIILLQSEEFRSALEPSIMGEVVHILEETKEDRLRVTAFEFLNQLVFDEKFSSKLAEEYADTIWNTIVKHYKSLPTAAAAAQLISTSAKNNVAVANAFIKAGALHWMIQVKELNMVPIWKVAIDVLFSKHLPAKFAYKRRLEFTDLITDHFYVTREGISREKQLNDRFPVYDEVLKAADDLSLPTIYLVSLVESDQDNDSKKRNSSSSKQSRKSSGRTMKLSINKGTNGNGDTLENSSEVIKFDFNGKDFFLEKYVDQVKRIFKETELAIRKNEEKDCVLTDKETKSRIQVLAKYISDQLSGPDRSSPCTNHYLTLHIEQLKNELSSNLIPIGLLRAGLTVERAILFKVLADQVGLPCALVRGLCGQTWVEVSLPAVSPRPPCYPSTLLKPTHIVDLTHAGNLLPLGSFAANKYSTCPCFCAYDKRDDCIIDT